MCHIIPVGQNLGEFIHVKNVNSIHIGPKNVVSWKKGIRRKRDTQNLDFKEENCRRFYSWGLQRTVVKKSLFNSVLPRLLFFFFIKRLLSPGVLHLALLSLVCCWYFHISRIADWLSMKWVGVSCDLCWTCLETCLKLPKSRYLISL